MKDFREYCDVNNLDNKLKCVGNRKDYILTITDEYLKGLKKEVSLDVIIYDIIDLTNSKIDTYNLEILKKSNLRKYSYIISLNALQVAKIAMYYYKVSKFFWNVEDLDSNKFSLSFYQKDGYNKGLYNTCNSDLNKILRIINPIMKIYEVEEALRYFRSFAPEVVRTTDKDLIPVNNGIFDYKNKKLLDFDPKYAFLSKSRVDFNNHLINYYIEYVVQII